MKKRTISLFLAALYAVFLLCSSAFAVQLSVSADKSVCYTIHIEATLPIDLAQFDDVSFVTNFYRGSTLTASDSKGKTASVSLQNVTIGGSQITAGKFSVSPFGGENSIAKNGKTLSVAAALTFANNTVEPSTLLDMTSFSVPILIGTSNDEQMANFSSYISSVKVTAQVTATPLGNTITADSFNNGRGLRNSQYRAISACTGDITMNCSLLKAADATQIVTIESDLNNLQPYTLVKIGDTSFTITLTKEMLYDAEYGEYFEWIKFNPENTLSISKISFHFSSDNTPTNIGIETIYLNSGAQYRLTAGSGSYFSSADKKIASVNANGLITANAVGQTEIFVNDATDSIASRCAVIVISSRTPSTSIKLSSDKYVARVGGNYTLNATLSARSTDKVTWICSDSSILDINPKTGKFTALAPGKATVTAVSSSGLTTVCTVTVKMPK